MGYGDEPNLATTEDVDAVYDILKGIDAQVENIASRESEERRAWDMYASAGMIACSVSRYGQIPDAAKGADSMLAERRKRFPTEQPEEETP